jgi:4-amino-4-deoxy-L-arabinose transferase-like glycosyltransferase
VSKASKASAFATDAAREALPPEAPRPGIRRALLAAAIILAAVAVGLAFFTASRMGPCHDEVSHLPAGYSYVLTGKPTVNPQHPPLIKWLAGLSLYLWRSDLALDRDLAAGPNPKEWQLGREFLFHQPGDTDHTLLPHILLHGRIPNVLLFGALLLIVLAWSWSLFGPTGALLSTALAAASPGLIAHASLVTFDTSLAATFLLACFLLRRYFVQPSPGRLVLAGIGLGLALVTKYSAVVLVPAFALVFGVDVASRKTANDIKRAVTAFLAVLAVAVVTMWVVYGFPLDPDFYFSGLRQVNADHDPHLAYYLAGHAYRGHNRLYYVIAVLVKEPLGSLTLMALAIIAIALGWRRPLLEEALLVVPPAALFAATTLFADNMGVRHALPCLPFACISCGRLALAPGRLRPSIAGLAASLALFSLASSWRVAPYFLSYFNEAAGGSAQGERWLDDSNIEWGTGLPELHEWTRRKGISLAQIWWPWKAIETGYEFPGVPASNSVPDFDEQDPAPGYYAVSRQFLLRARFTAARFASSTPRFLERATLVERLPGGMIVFRVD